MRAAVLLALAFCAAARASVVEGRVVSTTTGQPVRHALVMLQREGVSYAAETQSDGKFRIEGVSLGMYRASALRQGWIALGAGRFPPKPEPDLLIRGGEDTVQLTLRLTPPAVIAGRTLDPDGDPVSNLSVEALRFSYSGGRRQLTAAARAVSDDHGEYRIFNLSPGRYFIIASRQSAAAAFTFYPAAADSAHAVPVDVAAAAEQTRIDIRLQPDVRYSIHARSSVATRRPLPTPGNSRPDLIPPFMPMLERRGGDFARITGIGMRLEGDTFEIQNIPPGSYALTAQQTDPDRPGVKLAARQAIEIVDHDIDVTLAVAPMLEIHGTVAGPEGFEKTRVSLEAVDGGVRSNATGFLDAAGRLVIRDVAAGRYRLRVTAPAGAYLQSIRNATQTLSSQDLDIGREAPALQIVLAADGGTVRGLALNSQGEPANRALVTAAIAHPGWPDQVKSAITDEHGNFAIDDLAPGDYRLFAWDTVEPGAPDDPDFRKLYEPRSTPVHVEPGKQAKVTIPVIE